MKPKMMSKRQMNYLFDHILDGFRSSHEGIVNLQRQGLATEEDVAVLVKKNSERLIERIAEFRLHEKIFGLLFACLFYWLQVSNQDLEMRRAKRLRLRRRNETEKVNPFIS